MLRLKKGASIISLVLCAVAMVLVTTALVFATNNSAMYRAELIASKQKEVVESSAYSKVYTRYEIESIARQAFANNYLSLYDKEVDFEGFEALVIGEIMQTVPANQLEEYEIQISYDGVSVEHK